MIDPKRLLKILSASPAKEFENAKTMPIMDLVGRSKVTILSGPFKLYKTVYWIKDICTSPIEGVIGHNEIQEYNYFKEPKIQGFFNVEVAQKHLVLNYNVVSNTKSFWLRMKDHVRKTDFPGEYIGKIFVKIGWVYIPAGYFALSKNI